MIHDHLVSSVLTKSCVRIFGNENPPLFSTESFFSFYCVKWLHWEWINVLSRAEKTSKCEWKLWLKGEKIGFACMLMQFVFITHDNHLKFIQFKYILRQNGGFFYCDIISFLCAGINGKLWSHESYQLWKWKSASFGMFFLVRGNQKSIFSFSWWFRLMRKSCCVTHVPKIVC